MKNDNQQPKDVLRDEPSAKQRVLAINQDLICRAYSLPTEWSIVDSGTGECWGHSEESAELAWADAASKLSPVPPSLEANTP